MSEFQLLAAFVDELARCGLNAVCTSPGSRSTPLLLELTRDQRFSCYSHIDERCAAFFALGMAKATQRPTALIATSGTATAEYLPAVIEAYYARVPLIVLTADRPPELRDNGAGQTIDQLKLYGNAVKWFFEVGTHKASSSSSRWYRALACRAYWTASQTKPGPVHLNFPLREPLSTTPVLPLEPGRPAGRPWIQQSTAITVTTPEVVNQLATTVNEKTKGVIIAGALPYTDTFTETLARFSLRSGYPILADPLSNLRSIATAIGHYDGLLRCRDFCEQHNPDVIIRIGDIPTSKPVRNWLAELTTTEQVLIDPHGTWQDPATVVSLSIPADPNNLFSDLTKLVDGKNQASAWNDSWVTADKKVNKVINNLVAQSLFEPSVTIQLGSLLPAKATLFVASSMPIRDVESFWPARQPTAKILANRGANGIDGTLASALGVCASKSGSTVLLIGDVAFAYDCSALAAAQQYELNLTIIVINNNGGGIFHFLPIAEQQDQFEQYIATPPNIDIEQVAKLYKCDYSLIEAPQELAHLIKASITNKRTTILEIRTDRAQNVAVHERVNAAIQAAI